MANNRVTYATAQVSIKDNKVAETSVISNDYVVGILSSGISDADIEVGLTAVLDGVWPDECDIMIDNEQIHYESWSTTSGCGTLTRGANGTTAISHLVAAEVKLKAWEVPYGMQNTSISTAFNTEDVFQIGQLDTYENLETLPEIEVSMERVLDGTKPLWLMCTDSRYSSLKGRTADFKVDIAVNVYPDSQDSATGTADSVVFCSGMYISSISYNFTTDGNFTESVTMIGNDKAWGTLVPTTPKPSGHFPTAASFNAAVVGEGVQRSENFNPHGTGGTLLPAEISTDDHIQSVSVSADIGREDIYELGTKAPYYRAVSFPIEVTCSFEVITSKGDGVNALSAQDNLTARQITITSDGGLTINLGANNKLTSVSYGDFSTGGDSTTCTFEYSNSNSLLIEHTAE